MNFNSNISDEEVYSSVSLDMSALDKLDEITQRLTMDALSTPDRAETSTKNATNCEHSEHVHTRKKRSLSDSPIICNDEEIKYRKKLFPEPDKVLREKIRCTACGTSLLKHVMKGRGLYFHPILQVLVCQDCREFYGDGDFPVDDDGSDTYCRWCAQGGSLYCCSACSYVFCKPCVRRNFKKSMLEEIEEEDWKCFICNPEALWKHRAVCWAARERVEDIPRNDNDSETSDDEQQQVKRRSGLRKGNPKEGSSGIRKNRTKSSQKNSEDDTYSDTDEADKAKTAKRKKEKEKEKEKLKEREKGKEKEKHKEKEKERHKEREKERNKEREKERQKEREKERDKERDKVKHKEGEKERDTEKHKERNKEKNKERDREKEKQKEEKDKSSKDKEKSSSSSTKERDKVSRTKEKEDSSKKEKVNDKKLEEKRSKDKHHVASKEKNEKEENERAKLDESFLKSGGEEYRMDCQGNTDNKNLTDDEEARKIAAMKKTCHMMEKLTKEAQHVSNSVAKKTDQLHTWISMKNRNSQKQYPTTLTKLGKMITSFKKILHGLYVNAEELQNKVAEAEKDWKNVFEPDKNDEESPENVVNVEESRMNGVESEKEEKEDASLTLKPVDKDENNAQVREEEENQSSKISDVEDDSKLNGKSKECLNGEVEKVKTVETGRNKFVESESEKEKVNGDEGNVGSLKDTPEKSKSNDEDTPEKSKSNDEDRPKKSKSNDEDTPEKSMSNDEDRPEKSKSNDDDTPGKSKSNDEDTPEKSKSNDGDLSGTETAVLTKSAAKEVYNSLEEGEVTNSKSWIDGLNDSLVDEEVEGNETLIIDENAIRAEEKSDETSIQKNKDGNNENEEEAMEVDESVDKVVQDEHKDSDKIVPDLREINTSVDIFDDEEQSPTNIPVLESDNEEENDNNLLEKDISQNGKEDNNDLNKDAENNKDDNDKSEALSNDSSGCDDRLQEKENSEFEDETSTKLDHQKSRSKSKKVDDSAKKNTIENEKKDVKSVLVELEKENLNEEVERIKPSKDDRDAKMEFLLDTSLTSEGSDGGEVKRKKKFTKKKTKNSSESSDSDSSVNEEVVKGKKSCSGALDEKVSDTELVSQFHDEKLKAGCFVHLKKMNCHNPVTSEPKHNKNVNKKDSLERAINRLGDLKSLDKASSKLSDEDDSDNKRKKSKEKNKELKKSNKEKKNDEVEKSSSDEDPPLVSDDSNMDDIDNPKNVEKMDSEMNEIAKKLLCDSSPSDFDLSDDDDDKNKKNEKKKVDKTSKEDKSEEEDKKKKADDGDKGSSSDDFDFDQSKKAWRKDKLLSKTLNASDSDEKEKKWKSKKKKQSKAQSDSDEEPESKVVKTRKLRRRRLASSSSSDCMKLSSDKSDSDSSDSDEKNKKRKRKAKSDSSESSESKKKKKLKRRRIKAVDSDSKSSGNDEDKEDTPNKGRKNIRKVLKGERLGEETKAAAKDEEERRKRISERQKLYNEIFTDSRNLETLEKLVLDFNPETKKELVYVDPVLVKKLKPHQAEGIKFMWDACFESLKRMKTEKGSGCILAHCMGLGKTLQVIALVHTLLSNPKTKVKTVLVICPVNTVLNWVNEFNIWLKDLGTGKDVEVFEISKYKVNVERMYQLKDWQSDGGVMVIGYDMYRNLVTPGKRVRKKVQEVFQSTLADPGPDLVVCDEGHLLKNISSALSKAVNAIKTARRIVLTGTPLQNNLKEYHCMIQFVKPSLLGTHKEFLNRFVNPISNGQCADSTPHDVRVMKRRAHVLHKMLEGCVQRCDYSVLTPFLPPKHEYVMCIRLTELQSKLYIYYIENLAHKSGGTNLFNDFQNLQRIWTHPRVLKMSSEKEEKKRLMQSDSEGSLKDFVVDDDEDESDTTTPSSDSSDSKIRKKRKKMKRSCKNGNSSSSESSDVICLSDENKEKKSKENESNEEDQVPAQQKEWWEEFVEPEDHDKIIHSGKLMLLLEILQKCELIGDKVLLFSQSLYSLNLIEYFLEQIDEETQKQGTEESTEGTDAEGTKFKFIGSWAKGLDYFRIDGSVSGENRSIWCKAFNKEENTRARLFLISTRAGGMGINLVGANRVVLFDASWNPSSDLQSIFRIYRFGQKKPCYVYRFLAQGTMEEKIYNRQVTKLSLASRVLDEHQIERHFNFEDLQELYTYDPTVKSKKATPMLPKDRLLAELIQKYSDFIDNYHEHDSLLENKAEEELTEEERKAAWEDFENDKKEKLPDNNLLMGAMMGGGFPNQMFPGQIDMTGNPNQMFPGQFPEIPGLMEAIIQKFPNATEDQLSYELRLATNRISQYFNRTNQQQMFNQMAPQNQVRGPMFAGMRQQMHQQMHQQMPQHMPQQAAYMQARYGLQNYYHNPLIPSSSTNSTSMLLPPQVPNSGSHYVPGVMNNLQQQLLLQQQNARSTMQPPVQKAPEENTVHPVKLKIRNDLMPGTIEVEDDSDIIIEEVERGK